jgi:plasmid stabilization system protein ParE
MKFSFHPEAEQELLAAVDYYDRCVPSLGEAFAIEAAVSIVKILEFPLIWPVLEHPVRRCLTHRFPFALLYAIDEDEIRVIAAMHLRREPGYWKSRIE